MTFQIGPSGQETIVVNSQAMTVSGIQAAIWDAKAGLDRDELAKDPTGNSQKLNPVKYTYDKAKGNAATDKEYTVTELKTGYITSSGMVAASFQTEADKFKNIKLAGSTAASTLLPSLNISGSSTVVANAAIDTINAAINAVSSYRAKLGAAQNRLEHTVNNLKVTSENITSAESRIRDTDMADEITAFTKNNILLQASQSMLAQSNSVPQSILSLLQ